MKRALILLWIVVWIFAACKKEKVEKETVAEKNTAVSGEHRCANCGMYTLKHPNWEQKVISDDKGTMYFDGPRCMFKVLLDSTVAPKIIREIHVKDYYSLQYIDGKSAYYVIGSDVLGPMGNELIPFRTKSAAEEFLKDHKGETVVQYDDVDMKMIMRLAGKMEME
ncbi:MAG: nitrous oxide reductase accessory protein NosL [Calditrichaceae bacterium]|jgi:copper chaperone NosL